MDNETKKHNDDLPITPSEIIPISESRIPLTKQSAKEVFLKMFEGSDQEKKITTLTKKLNKIKITSPNDKEAYKELKEVKNKLTKVETAIEARRKELKEPSLQEGKDIDAIADEFFKMVSPYKDKAVAKLKEADLLFKAEEDRIAKEAEDRKRFRITELELNGCLFQGQWWAINDISLGTQQIQEMPEESWVELIEKVKVQKQLNDDKAKKEKEDSDAKEAKDKLEKDRLEKLKPILSFVKEDFSKCADWSEVEFDKIYSDALSAKKNKDKEEEDQKSEIREMRKSQLEMLGIEYGKEHEKLVNESTSEEWRFYIDKYKKEKKEKEEKETKDKEDRETLAVNAKPFEELGFRHDYNTKNWVITINRDWDKGTYHHTITKEEMLSPKEGLLQELSTMIAGWNKEIEDKKEEKRLNDLFASRRVQLLTIGFEITPSGSFKISYNDAESESVIPSVVRDETDEQFNEYITSVKAKIEKESEKKRQAQLDDIAKYNEWIDKLKAIEPPTISDDLLNKSITLITSYFNKK